MRFWLLLCAVLYASLGWAHEAPSGWEYPIQCCSNNDCRWVPPFFVRPTGDGWILRDHLKHEFVPISSPKVKVSGDGEYHICRTNFGKGDLLCLFIPPMVGM